MTNDEHVTISAYRMERAREALATCKLAVDTDTYGAANRLYYAVFSAMRSVLALEGVDFKKHSAVISHFRQQYIKTGIFSREYSELIRGALQLRTDSDYKDFYVPNREEIMALIEEADSFITDVEKYLKGSENGEG